MLSGPKGTEQDLVGQCSVCGRIEALFELPGRIEKCCFDCSADLATAILLSTEIDAATLAEKVKDLVGPRATAPGRRP